MQQRNSEIFKEPIFDLPKLRTESNIEEYINILFSEYLSGLLKFKGQLKSQLNSQIPFIENQIGRIKLSLSLYLQGFPSAAYNQLSEALNLLLSKDYLPIQKAEINSNSTSFYRVRVSNNKTLKREELFHIPFEIREKVSTQRYSIPGLPCLYLADSIFVCWEEMGRPSIDSLHASRLDLSHSHLKFLYFNTSINDLRKKCFPKKYPDGILPNILIPFLCYWPMLAACSLIVRKPEDVFKPEYIIPQLLLQWVVSEQHIDGVVYKSNRIKVTNHNLGTFNNVVLPVRKIHAQGLCPELVKKIKLTNPVSYQLLEMTGSKFAEKAIEVADLRRAMYIELIDGEKSIYTETVFGRLEKKLATLQTKHIYDH